MRKIFLILSILVVLGISCTYGENDISKVDNENINNMVVYSPFMDTVEEATKKSKTGNPLDLVVAYKNYQESKGETIDSDELVDWHPVVEDPNEIIPSIVSKLYKYKLEKEANIRDNIIPTSDNIEYKSNISKTNNVKKIIVISILLLIFIALFVMKRNKVFLILGCIVIVYGMFSIFIIKQVEDKHNHIENYILGTSNKHIAKNIDIDKSINSMKDTLNLKYDVSNLINDYILRYYVCINLSNKYEKLSEEEYDTYDSLGYSSFSGIFDITGYPENAIFEDTALYKYNEYKANTFNSIDEMLSPEIQKEGIMYEDMVKICNNISNDKSISFDRFIKELNNCIKIKDTNPNEVMFKYVNRIMSDAYVLHSHKYYDNSVISYFKDWYIDGESRDIELPYGVTLEYRAPEFVKKDIKEIVYTNERELDHDSNEKQVYVMYYKDSEGKLGASYTDVEFTKTGTNYEISFNPVDLMYDIKKPTARLVVK